MNKLLLSAAAGAILLPLAACADKSAESEAQAESTIESPAADDALTSGELKTATLSDPRTSTRETAYDDDADTPTDYDAQSITYLNSGSLSAKELLGESIEGVNGERIARIDDIVIDANGKAESVVFLAGDVFGLGGKRGALDYNAVDIAIEDDFEPLVRVSLSDEGIKSAADYVTTEVNDYSLVSELIGAQADLMSGAGNGEDVVINDIILADNGMIEHLIVQKSAVGSIGAGEKYAVAYSKLTVAEGDGGLILNVSEDELDAAPRFSAMRKAADNSWDKTKGAASDAWNNTKDAADKAWDNTKDAADDAGDEIEDTVD